MWCIRVADTVMHMEIASHVICTTYHIIHIIMSALKEALANPKCTCMCHSSEVYLHGNHPHKKHGEVCKHVLQQFELWASYIYSLIPPTPSLVPMWGHMHASGYKTTPPQGNITM